MWRYTKANKVKTGNALYMVGNVKPLGKITEIEIVTVDSRKLYNMTYVDAHGITGQMSFAGTDAVPVVRSK